jgi:hypothetical protein
MIAPTPLKRLIGPRPFYVMSTHLDDMIGFRAFSNNIIENLNPNIIVSNGSDIQKTVEDGLKGGNHNH